MAKLRDLVNRRKAVRNIRKITRTMELIATARFKKAMDRAAEADAYTKKIAELAADLTQSAGDVTHPLLSVRPAKKAMLLVICSNRGLCGGYNGSILREAQVALRKNKDDGGLLLFSVTKGFLRIKTTPTSKISQASIKSMKSPADTCKCTVPAKSIDSKSPT